MKACLSDKAKKEGNSLTDKIDSSFQRITNYTESKKQL